MRWLLLLFAVSGSAFAEADSNSATNVGATSTENARVIPAARNWYAGGAIGLSYLTGWDDASVTYMYASNGYRVETHSETLFLFDISKEAYELTSWEGKIYGGYRLLDYLDLEIGYTRNDNWNPTRDTSNSAGYTIKSERRVHAQALYASIALRPFARRGHGLYFKLGAHSSELKISKTVTGTAPNLSTIAAADNLPGDGVSRGYGGLYGLGFDFSAGRNGAVRLEWSHFNKLGGTQYGKNSINIGFLGNF
jgi:hypothetical protein